MSGVLDRQEVIAVLDAQKVGRHVPAVGAALYGYREVIADALMKLDEPVAAFVQVACTDMEDYARIFNEGYEEATRQLTADVPNVKADALRAAAAEQRRLSGDARTNNGQAEHEDIADWLEERADQVAGVLEGGDGDDARMGLVIGGEQGLGTCSPERAHLIADGEAVTSCCHRTPFELPRTERITVDPALANCRPLLDRAAVDAALIANADSLTRQGDAVLELARPMPTDDQVEDAVSGAWLDPNASCGLIVHAVLALLKGGQS